MDIISNYYESRQGDKSYNTFLTYTKHYSKKKKGEKNPILFIGAFKRKTIYKINSSRILLCK